LETAKFPVGNKLPKTLPYLARNTGNINATSFRNYTKNIGPNDKLKGNIIILLRKIFDIVVKDYKYVDCIKIYLQYVHLFSYGDLLDVNTLFTHFQKNTKFINISYCHNEYKLIFDLLNSPYFIYPTFHKINDYKFLQLLRAPILTINVFNNILINKNINISKYIKPCLQIYYDIELFLNNAHFIFNPSKNANNEDIYTNNNYFVKWLNNYIIDLEIEKAKIVLSILKTIVTMDSTTNTDPTFYLKDDLKTKIYTNETQLIAKFNKEIITNISLQLEKYN
jgi:hypothetical protein